MKNITLRIFYIISTFPLLLISKILIYFNLFNLKTDFNKCIKVIQSKFKEIPDTYIKYLIIAEDHRYYYHCGIDQIAILRALFKNTIFKSLEGASTIEQQFVRTVTNNYKISLWRKIKEQILAIAISSKKDKNNIAKAYLAIAYYGYNYIGANGIQQILNKENLYLVTENEIISIIARLKYPQPKKFSIQWQKRHINRKKYIYYRFKKLKKTLKLFQIHNSPKNQNCRLLSLFSMLH